MNPKDQERTKTEQERINSMLLATIYSADLPLERPVLTDNLAPVEYYNSEALQLYREPK